MVSFHCKSLLQTQPEALWFKQICRYGAKEGRARGESGTKNMRETSSLLYLSLELKQDSYSCLLHWERCDQRLSEYRQQLWILPADSTQGLARREGLRFNRFNQTLRLGSKFEL